MCSDCGFVLKKLDLSVREWVCPSCGCVHDRDENAAVNLERLGYPEFPGSQGEEPKKPVEIPLTAERSREIVRSTSHGSMKQEANIGGTL
jgi:putative transposase